jgi:hypothetical protein
MHAHSLLAYSGNYETHYVIELAKEQQAIVLGECAPAQIAHKLQLTPHNGLYGTHAL